MSVELLVKRVTYLRVIRMLTALVMVIGEVVL